MSDDAKPWTVDETLEHHTILWRVSNEAVLEFELYQSFVSGTERYYLSKEGSGVPEEKITEAEIWCRGSLRFDGCINYDHPSLTDPEGPCLLHACGRGDFKEQLETFERLYDLAAEQMPDWADTLGRNDA